MRLAWVLVLLLGLVVWAGAPVPTSGYFRITQTMSRSTATPGAWRYVITPRTKEARSYWKILVDGWTGSLKIGLPVRFGPYRLELEGRRLKLSPGCAEYHPRCYSHPAIPPGFEEWKLDLILLDFHNALVWALEDAKKRSDEYPATVTASRFVRLHVNRMGAFLAEPLGWKP